MSASTNQQPLTNPPSTRARPSLFNQSHNPSNRKTQRDVLPHSENKKNLKSKNSHIVLQQLKIDDSKQNSLHKSNPITKQLSNSLRSNKELIAPSPFNNLSNFKPHHLEPLDIHITKEQLFEQNFIQKHSPKTSPKLGKKQRQICQKLYQQKLSNLPETKRKSVSHRIHITSSKQKENNFKKINQDKLALYSQNKLNLKANNESKQTVKPQFPEIEENMLPILVSSRQKSSHSFMIRKKIASTSLQTQKPQRTDKKPFTLPMNYRKDRFIKQEKDDFINENNDSKPQLQNGFQKFESQQSNMNTVQKNLQSKLQKEEKKQDNQNSNKIIKNGKSLKLRKGRYSRADEFTTQKQVFTQKYHNQRSNQKSKFRNTIQDYLEIKNIHEFESKASQIQKKSQIQEKQKQASKEFQLSNSRKQETFQNAKQENLQRKLIDDKKQVQPPTKQSLIQSLFKSNEEKPLTNSQLKSFRKRVSSIRALKNCFKNFQTEEQSQFLTDSRIGQPTKRKQKQAVCLTHKIKWGTQSRKKSISQKGIQFVNNLNTEILIDEKFSQKKITDKVTQQRHDLIDENKKQTQKPRKGQRHLRFSDELQELEIDSPCKKGISRVASKKESSIYLENVQTSEQVQALASRSLIVFDDPGISIIVRKDSSAQSSDLQPGYNTIDINLQESPRKYNSHKKSDSARLESLRELFFELKSHKSIYIPEEKQEQQAHQKLIEEQKLQNLNLY